MNAKFDQFSYGQIQISWSGAEEVRNQLNAPAVMVT